MNGRHNKLRGLFLILFGFATVATATGQDERGRYLVTNLSAQDYGGHEQNWAITADHDGLLYVGNSSGVLVFDGVSWRLIEMPNGAVVRSLATGPQGTIFVGGQDEIGYLRPDSLGAMVYVSLRERLPEEARAFNDVWRTFAMSDAVFFQTGNFVFRVRLAPEGGPSGAPVRVWHAEETYGYLHQAFGTVLLVDKDTDRLLWYQQDDFVPVPSSTGFPAYRAYVFVADGPDQAWMITRNQGVFQCTLVEAIACETLDPATTQRLSEAWAYTGVLLPDGRLAVGTIYDGMHLINPDGTTDRILRKPEGLRDDFILYTYVDAQHGLWLGLNDGLARVSLATPATLFEEAQGLPGGVMDLVRYEGTLYAATSSGIFRMQPGQPTQAAQFEPILASPDMCWSFVLFQGSLLAGCGSGLHRIAGSEVRATWGSSNVFYTLATSEAWPNRVWAGTLDGLVTLDFADTNADPVITERFDQVGVTVRNLRIVPDATAGGAHLWVGTYKQAARAFVLPGTGDLQDVRFFDEEDGLPAGYVASFWMGEALVFATEGGLYTFDAATERFAPHSTAHAPLVAHGLSGKPALTVVHHDAAGNLWTGVNGPGLSVMPLRNVPSDTVYSTPFARADLGTIYDFLEEDAMWVGTAKGLLRYEGAYRVPNPLPFQALVRKVATLRTDSLLFAGTQHAGLSPTVLPYDERNVRLQVGATNLERTDRTVFRYRLLPYEDAWSDWTEETSRDYTNLYENTYTFEVQAQNVDGSTSAVAGFSFQVMPPWYRSLWAYALYGLGVLLVIGGGVQAYGRRRMRLLKLRNRRLEERVFQRTYDLEASKAALEEANTELTWANEELHRTNDALERQSLSLQEALNQNTEILGITSHDLKNPLGGILGMAELSLADLDRLPAFDGKAALRENIELIHLSAGQMRRPPPKGTSSAMASSRPWSSGPFARASTLRRA